MSREDSGTRLLPPREAADRLGLKVGTPVTGSQRDAVSRSRRKSGPSS